MPAFNPDPDRQVIPRWRSFASTVAFGEAAPLKQRPPGVFTPAMLGPLFEDWRREPSLSVAADLVSAGFAIGCLDAVREAAEYVLHGDKNAPQIAREIAAQCLGIPLPAVFSPLDNKPATAKARELVRSTRARLSDYPFNPVAWTNLSRLFTVLGESPKAERAMRVALGLAPTNRFVLRAASRLFLHLGQIDAAHDVLLNSASLKHDPWILAGEIAIASIRHRSSECIKTGRRLIDSENYSPFHLSELAGALATLEATNGAIKKARKLCDVSLRQPAENAIAQVAWLNRRIGGFGVPSAVTSQVQSSEANAYTAEVNGLWTDALRYATEWYIDQPFSSRPAMMASYVASTAFDQFADAERILWDSLHSNPNDAMLRNNLAFALAQQGRVNEASEVVAKIDINLVEIVPRICLTATFGLISFRAGKVDEGREAYRRAIQIAHGETYANLRRVAFIYAAIEEIRIGSKDAVSQKTEALEEAKKLPAKYSELFTRKLQAALLMPK